MLNNQTHNSRRGRTRDGERKREREKEIKRHIKVAEWTTAAAAAA